MTGLEPSSSGGNSSATLSRRDVAAEPAQARDEDELQLRDDRPLDAHEQVVELAVLEMILDPGAADPADPAVDDDDLAMVDVSEAAEVPAGGAARIRADRVVPAAASHGPRTPESRPRVIRS